MKKNVIGYFDMSDKPIGKLVKSFVGDSGHTIDVYYDESVNGLDYWSDPNGVYIRVFNNCLNSYSIVNDCLKNEPEIYKELNNG